MQLIRFHALHYRNLAKTDFWIYEFSVWLHTLARSFIVVFIPILILKAGYSVNNVVLYYAIYTAFDIPLNFLARSLVKKIGARLVIILGSTSSIAFFATLSLIDKGWAWLILLAGFSAVYDSFYWVAHKFLFIEVNEGRDDVGRTTGILYSIQRLARMIGPAIGAAILIFSNQLALIILSSVVFAISIIPLLYVKHLPDKPEKPQLGFKEFFKNSKERRNYISSALYNIHIAAEDVIWPLFIFISFTSIESVAIIPIIVSLGIIVFSYITGKETAKGKRTRLIMFGASLVATMWILRLLIPLPVFYYISIFIIAVLALLVSIPIDTRIFARGRKLDPLSASTYVNASNMTWQFILYATLSLFVNTFNLSFILAALSLMTIFIINYIFFKTNNTNI